MTPKYFSKMARSLKFPPIMVLMAVTILPLVCSLVTYTFVSLPGNSIALNQNGALIALLVLLKIFILGVTGKLPVNLNNYFSKRRGKRAPRHLVEEVSSSTRRETPLLSVSFTYPVSDVLQLYRHFLSRFISRIICIP